MSIINFYNRLRTTYGGTPSQPWVLPDLEIAYSFKKRIATATKSIRIRRSSDNAETDILLDDSLECSINSLISDGGDLATWIGSNDGFMVTDYDQTGNFDLTQATASKQAKVVSAGAWLGYKDYDGVDDFYETSNLPTSTQGSVYIKYYGANNAVQYMLAEANHSLWSMLVFATNISTGYKSRIINFTGTNTVNQSIGNTVMATGVNQITYRSNGSAYTTRVNGTNQTISQSGSNLGDWFGDRTTGYNLQKGGIWWNGNASASPVAYREYEILAFNVNHNDTESLSVEQSM